MLVFETACQYILRNSSKVDPGILFADITELISLVPLTAFLGIYATSSQDASFLHPSNASDDIRVRISSVIYGLLDWAHTLPSNDRNTVWYTCLCSACSLLNHLSNFTDISDSSNGAFDEVYLLRFVLSLKFLPEHTTVSRVVRDIKNTADTCNWSSPVTSLIIRKVEEILSDDREKLCSSKTAVAHTGRVVDLQTPIKSRVDRYGTKDTITIIKDRIDKVETEASALQKVADDCKVVLPQNSEASSEEKMSESIEADDVLPLPPQSQMIQRQSPPLDNLNSFQYEGALGFHEQAGGLESALIWKSEEVSNKWNLPF